MTWNKNILLKTFKLGNDIVNVSTKQSQLKYLDQRFLHRVFNEQESNIILQKNNTFFNQSTALWAIWAAKEAAFKACKKQNIDLIFSHRKFKINLPVINSEYTNSLIIGTANYEGTIIALTWQIYQHTVHCIAVLLDNNAIFTNWEQINYNIFTVDSSHHLIESFQTKYYAKQFLRSKGLDPQLEIIRQNGPPMLFVGKIPLPEIEISLSHDHGWGAVAFINLLG